jgi:ribulose-phosphate 3-epimerase
MIAAGADWLHVDIMDGHFVDNLTLGPVVFQGLRRAVGDSVFLDCHFMTTAPAFWVEAFARVNGESKAVNWGCTFHYEVFGEDGLPLALELCSRIRALQARPAVALRPSTPPEAVLPLVEAAAVDMVLVMTVEPGHGGQKFMPECLSKAKFLRERYPLLDIEVDGGISPETATAAAQAGCNILVSGSAVFGAGSKAAQVIEELREAIVQAG